MGIQERLKQQRYGEQYILLPNKDELKSCNCYTNRNIRHALIRDNIPQQVIGIYSNPPKGDKYLSGYMELINDFNKYRTTSRPLTRLAQRTLIDRLLYFYRNQSRYGSFEVYAIAWVVKGMFEMRRHIMRKKADLGEMPLLIGLRHTPMSAGFYKYPKPMANKAMLKIANRLHDMLYPYIEKLI